MLLIEGNISLFRRILSFRDNLQSLFEQRGEWAQLVSHCLKVHALVEVRQLVDMRQDRHKQVHSFVSLVYAKAAGVEVLVQIGNSSGASIMSSRFLLPVIIVGHVSIEP